jgi:hypothetical protein
MMAPARRGLHREPGMAPAVGVLLAAGLAAAAAPPTIQVDKPVHDFGTVPEGEKIRHLFTVKNTGGSPLEIKSVSATCGCTAAAPREKQIPPGGSGQIEVTFDTRNRPGVNEKTVTVVSSDPRTPTLQLRIRAEVESMLGLEPAYTQLEAAVGEKRTVETWLRGKLAARARPRLTTVDPPAPLRAEAIERQTPEGKQRGLRVVLESRQIAQGNARLMIATGLPQLPQVEHTVIWTVRGNIEAPTHVHLNMGRPGGGERLIPVTSRRSDFRLKAARILQGPFTATVQEPSAASAQRSIKLVANLNGATATYATGKLLLESNDPLEPRKEVSLSVSAPAPAPAAARPPGK